MQPRRAQSTPQWSRPRSCSDYLEQYSFLLLALELITFESTSAARGGSRTPSRVGNEASENEQYAENTT
ncbi:hypothetical protein L596_007107 [Steinernema carpocapsae]|uniref:Uncharacterized protein n=1 Tax=Steinernema carpocapsae TaxID=34508 RepID=A0A4U5P8N7_STECR|nr:hypothetical protein L596_007107 [Steinernema carpocapsae]